MTLANNRCRFLMVQGTASHAGKSTLVAALCRIFAQDGIRVAPFKAQNMSLNSAATADGGEIGRAQMLQAAAARVRATVHMNPILLKPQGESESQVIIHGRPARVASARDYYRRSTELWPSVIESLELLASEYDVVVIEGAGSPAEINMRDRDITNMRVALHTSAPVILVGDIERGGVFASLYGTVALMRPEERALVRGFVINKFRGDTALLDPGPAMLYDLTAIPTLGVVPYLRDVHLPDEDSLGIRATPIDHPDPEHGGMLEIAVIRLPHIANFDDFDPLQHYSGVRVRFVRGAADFGKPHLVVIPGSKSTVADLLWLEETGLSDCVRMAHAARVPIIGICGGYQMLGGAIFDPDGVESSRRDARGLDVLPVATRFDAAKRVAQIQGSIVSGRGILSGCAGNHIRGYEIHHGHSEPAVVGEVISAIECQIDGRPIALGVTDPSGGVLGTYVHGLFHNHSLCEGMLRNIARMHGIAPPVAKGGIDVDLELDKLAGHVRRHVEMDFLYQLIGHDVAGASNGTVLRGVLA